MSLNQPLAPFFVKKLLTAGVDHRFQVGRLTSLSADIIGHRSSKVLACSLICHLSTIQAMDGAVLMLPVFLLHVGVVGMEQLFCRVAGMFLFPGHCAICDFVFFRTCLLGSYAHCWYSYCIDHVEH